MEDYLSKFKAICGQMNQGTFIFQTRNRIRTVNDNAGQYVQVGLGDFVCGSLVL